MSRFPIQPERSALVIFDMLNCYVHPPDAERARQIAATGVIAACQRLLGAARATGLPICYVGSSPRADGSDYPPLITDADAALVPWPDGPRPRAKPTAVEGTPGVEVIPELAPRPGDHVFAKKRWSAFVGTPLDLTLRGLGVDTILLAGGSTDVGVTATAYAAIDLGYHLVVVRDACFTLRPGAQQFCMEGLFPRMGRVLTVEDAIALMARPDPTPAQPQGSERR
jgi:nicotinamidase-related amidase